MNHLEVSRETNQNNTAGFLVENNGDIILHLAEQRNKMNFMIISGRVLVEGIKKTAGKIWSVGEQVINYLSIDNVLKMVQLAKHKPPPQLPAPVTSVEAAPESLILTFLKGQGPLKATLLGTGIFLGGLMSLSLSGTQAVKISSYRFGRNAELKWKSTDGIQFAGIFYGLSREDSMRIGSALGGLLNRELTAEGCRNLRDWIARTTRYPFILSIVAGEAVYLAGRGPFRSVKGRVEDGIVAPINIEIMNTQQDQQGKLPSFLLRRLCAAVFQGYDMYAMIIYLH